MSIQTPINGWNSLACLAVNAGREKNMRVQGVYSFSNMHPISRLRISARRSSLEKENDGDQTLPKPKNHYYDYATQAPDNLKRSP
jgi:hypothetical protein